MLGSEQLSWSVLDSDGLCWAGLCTNRRECVKHGPRQLAPIGRQRPSIYKSGTDSLYFDGIMTKCCKLSRLLNS